MSSVDHMALRWAWIDRIVELKPGESCRAVKSVSLAELLPFYGDAGDDAASFDAQQLIFPPTLIIEGMAQTAGILVGATRDFAENVILAKISRAEFLLTVTAGYAVQYEAQLERLDDVGASIVGLVHRLDPADGSAKTLAKINLIFSHADPKRTGLSLPEHNFVFDGPLLKVIQSAVDHAS
jgi:3-hydroxyacyl-[acyl-carrier-protein] dehydratase